MHAYAYANNNPVTFSDPSGLMYFEYETGGGPSGEDSACTTFACGVIEGFFGRLNIFAAMSGIWKTIKNPKGVLSPLKADAERWGQKTGDDLAGWGCAISGLCDMYDACIGSFDAAECGRVVGGLAFQIIVSLGTAGAGGVAAKVASELRALANKFDIDIPTSIRDRYDVPEGITSPPRAAARAATCPRCARRKPGRHIPAGRRWRWRWLQAQLRPGHPGPARRRRHQADRRDRDRRRGPRH